MVRLIKRYGGGSRKLYDTEESRYVSLEEIATWVRAGQELQVLDSATGDDVTAQTLAQVIYESHRAGRSLLPPAFLHDAIRRGGEALTDRVGRLQRAVRDLAPGRAAPRELTALRRSLAALEASLADLETPVPAARRRRRARRARRT
jgi:polyhydroxyalkanoate synthesis repressor PhaR